MKTWLAAILGLAAIAAAAFPSFEANAQEQVTVQAAALTPDQQADIRRIEQYLNDMTTVSAKFQQYSAQDGLILGRIYLRRPGRLRVEYDPPSSVLLIADGLALSYYDRELDNLEQVPLNLSPLWFLLRDKVALGEDVTVTSFSRDAGNILLGIVQTKEPEAGQVILEFGDKPLELRQWVLIDSSGQSIRVGLYDAEFGVPLANELFRTPQKKAKEDRN